jgi:dihydrolipoamide dehydrogenase
VIIGGGVVACEMAQAMHGLGTRETTILARGQLLGSMDPMAARALVTAFGQAGIEVRTGAHVAAVDRPEPGGKVTVYLEQDSPVEADELLVATGRAPATEDLGLDAVGLARDSWVTVDDSMRATGVPGGWLYAVGDVNGRSLLTHVGKYQARVCGDVIVARAHGGRDDDASLRDRVHRVGAPQVVFTDPQIGCVGHTEASARAAGMTVRVVEYDLARLAGAYVLGDGYTGRAQIVVDEDRRVLVGATFVGPEVGELLHAATIAITSGATLEQLWHAVPPFPTLSEVWLRLLETYGL